MLESAENERVAVPWNRLETAESTSEARTKASRTSGSLNGARPELSSIRLDAPRPGASNRIELNSGRAPFNDPLVREAFVRASDVDSAVSSLFQGTATRSFSALSSIEPLGVSRPDLFGYDQAAAGT